MEKIKLTLPDFNYKNYNWNQEDNVTILDRSSEFEEQNLRYIEAGYNHNNSMYYRAFDLDEDIHKFCRTLFTNYSVGILKQPPGQTLPAHEDTFYKFAGINNINPYDCCRINIFLEDWQSGHYFEICEKPITNWKKGDTIIINRDEIHLSGNMGMIDKYTMQVTGIKNELERR